MNINRRVNIKAVSMIWILPLFLCLLPEKATAQPYRSAVGIRGGYSSGFTFKYFVERDFALDVQAVYNEHGFQFHGLYDYQFSPYNRERLYYYAGAGAYGGNWQDELALGLAAAAGAEFAFWSAPVSIGLEWRPNLNLYKVFDYALFDFALHFRVMLN